MQLKLVLGFIFADSKANNLFSNSRFIRSRKDGVIYINDTDQTFLEKQESAMFGLNEAMLLQTST
jgi:hypothetical protein